MNSQHFNAFRVAGVAILVGVMSGQALATNTDSAPVSAAIIKPITLFSMGPFSFGRLASVAGVVSIAAANGNRTSTNPANLLVEGSEDYFPYRAEFAVNGEPNTTYDISGGTGTITLSSGANSLVVTLTGVHRSSTNSIGTTGTLAANGAEMLGVGGSVTLAANTPSGNYTSATGVTLTVNYN